MSGYATRYCSCKAPAVLGGKRPVECEHGNRFQTEAELKPKERTPIRRVSERRQAEIDAGERPRTGSTLKAGRGFAVAQPQRAKVKAIAVCVGCGKEVEPEDQNWTIDPAHLWPRRFGGCDDELCVVPLCRHRFDHTQGCHPAYDANELDLHGKLLDRGRFKEMAHVIDAHEVSPLTLARELTGDECAPVGPFLREIDQLRARNVELESRVAA